MQRYVSWAVSALFALPIYAIATLAELPEVPVLLLTFVGAMGGAIAGATLGTKLRRRP